MTTAAPSAYKITYEVTGLAAHAGVRPEAWINAIQAAASGIARMRLGRIDHETTANIGLIGGGQARNIVPDRCTIKGEARSHDEDKLSTQVAHMQMCLEHAAKEAGARLLEPQVEASYRCFSLSEDAPVVQVARRAAEALALSPRQRSAAAAATQCSNEHGIPRLSVHRSEGATPAGATGYRAVRSAPTGWLRSSDRGS